MPCGCQTACGCNVVAGPGAHVLRVGDTFTVSSPGAVQDVFIQQADPGPLPYPYVWWELDGLGNLVTTWIWTP